MTDDRKRQDPSMEEILSSIRQIITEDHPAPEPKDAATTTAEGRDQPDDEVLELTDVVHEPGPRAAPVPPGPAGGVALSGLRERHGSAATPVADAAHEPLVSDAARATTTGAFARLAQAAAPERGPPPRQGEAGRTMEDAVLELMKPMLREWLDKNLPAIVERVVEEEVKKLVRRAENL